ncbi:hypothetical protein BGW80DRAFT_1332280 [Lactifluus volemus]|nr:hypothetical protein BGW80DRAFT_1332280 [Lactifluus volemus]
MSQLHNRHGTAHTGEHRSVHSLLTGWKSSSVVGRSIARSSTPGSVPVLLWTGCFSVQH